MTDSERFSQIYDELVALMKKKNIPLHEMTAVCLSWFMTWGKETVPKENRIAIMQKIEQAFLRD